MTLTRTTKIVTALLAIVTLGLGSLAAAQPGRRGPGGPHGFARGFGGPFPLLRQLDLTDAQREQVRAVFDQHKDAFQAIGEKLAAARKAQVNAIETVPADEQQIRTLTNELAAIEADAAVLRSQVYSAVYQVLTPEQQQKAKELKAQREARRAEARERWKAGREQRLQQRQQPQNPQNQQ